MKTAAYHRFLFFKAASHLGMAIVVVGLLFAYCQLKYQWNVNAAISRLRQRGLIVCEYRWHSPHALFLLGTLRLPIEISVGEAWIPDDDYAIAEILPDLIALGPHLTRLHCPNGDLTDKDAAAIGKMTGLTSLSIGGSNVTNVGCRHFASLSKLEFLEIYGPKLTDDGLAWVQNCTHLWWLKIGDAHIETDLFRNLSQNDWVYVGLPYCHVRSESLKSLAHFKTLRVLDLWHTDVDDGIASVISQLRALEEVNLASTRVTSHGVCEILKNCQALTDLSVQGCDVTIDAFCIDEQPPHLKFLNVQDTSLSGEDIIRVLQTHHSIVRLARNSPSLEPNARKRIDEILAARQAEE